MQQLDQFCSVEAMLYHAEGAQRAEAPPKTPDPIGPPQKYTYTHTHTCI